jgi:hypothetical protein
MLMLCFGAMLHAVTPRVLQLYPLKENLDSRFPVPSVGKGIGKTFNLTSYLQGIGRR